MTTQTSHHSGGTEYPQFSAGHAQYPPVTQHPQPASGYTPQQDPGYPPQPQQMGGYGQQQAGGHYAPQAAYDHDSRSQHAAVYGAPPQETPAYEAQQPYPQHASVYPTAPPWATTAPGQENLAGPAAGQHYPAATAPGQHYPATPWAAAAPGQEVPAPAIGGLLVPYPEEIRTAARAEAPHLWPVAVYTFFFGIFGAISASRRADQARRGANNAMPYWTAFLITLFAGGFIWSVVGLTVVNPAVDSVLQSRTISALEHNVVSDGQLTKANITAASADCQPAGDADSAGTRDYLCQLTLKNGEHGQLLVTAKSDGTWTQQEK